MDVRMYREIKAEAHTVRATYKDVFFAGVIRWMNASMRGGMYDSF